MTGEGSKPRWEFDDGYGTLFRDGESVGEIFRLGTGEEIVASLNSRDELLAMCEAVLIFHQGGPWTEEMQGRWFNAVQRPEATTKVLCDAIRQVLGKIAGQPTPEPAS